MNLTEQNLEQIEVWLEERKTSKNKRQNAWAKAKQEIYEKYEPKYENRAHKLAQGAGEIGRAFWHDRKRKPFTDEEAAKIPVMLNAMLEAAKEFELAEWRPLGR